MTEESPRCVMLGIYENDTGYPVCQVTDGSIIDPADFSCFMAQVHNAAEEAIATRIGYGTICEQHNPINHVMVETQRFMMISKRMRENLSIILVLRAPVECIRMPIELISRWEGRLLEALNDSGGLPVS